MVPASRSGFTLVEVLIVIAITALLAGLILTYSSSSRDQVSLYVEEAKLAQVLTKAKSLTISTYNQNASLVPCGYGVHINYPGAALPDGVLPNTYTLFSYDNELQSKCAITALDPSLETPIVTNELPPNLAFKMPDATSSAESVLFLPPNPSTWIWLNEAGAATSTEGQITLVSKSGALAVKVSVSSAGQITF